MCHKLDPRFFQELSRMDPRDVCRRTLAEFDRARCVYRVTALGFPYEVDPASCEVNRLSEEAPAVTTEWGLVILFYLLRAVEIPVSGKWVSEKDLQGGPMFFRGPHTFPVKKIATRYADDKTNFEMTARRFLGEPVKMGDAAMKLRVLPRVPVVIVLWLADEEFDSSARILMDSTIERHLPLDVIFGMATTLCDLFCRQKEAV